MRRGIQYISRYCIIQEILVRAALLAAVFIMKLNIDPHVRYITEFEYDMYYKRPRVSSFIPTWLLICMAVSIPLLFVCLSPLVTRNYVDALQALLAWSLAFSLNAMITESTKLIVGRPRPDFFHRCYPKGRYAPGDQCVGSKDDVLEGRKSFPSGHSSFSFCSLGFISIFLCGKLKVFSRNRGVGLRVVLCIIPLMLAEMVAISRWCDNHHHWEDIFVGSVLGISLSYFCYRQYFFPLNSQYSGYPYVVIPKDESFNALTKIQCHRGT